MLKSAFLSQVWCRLNFIVFDNVSINPQPLKQTLLLLIFFACNVVHKLTPPTVSCREQVELKKKKKIADKKRNVAEPLHISAQHFS